MVKRDSGTMWLRTLEQGCQKGLNSRWSKGTWIKLAKDSKADLDISGQKRLLVKPSRWSKGTLEQGSQGLWNKVVKDSGTRGSKGVIFKVVKRDLD